MVVVDTTGVHQIRYRRCGCDRSDTMNPRQELMRNGWFPATATDPDTCATLKMLEAFRLYNVIGALNCHDFVTALERMTSTVGSTGMVKVPVSGAVFFRVNVFLADSFVRIVTRRCCECHDSIRFWKLPSAGGGGTMSEGWWLQRAESCWAIAGGALTMAGICRPTGAMSTTSIGE